MNAAGTAVAAKPLGDSPFPLRRFFYDLMLFCIGLFFYFYGVFRFDRNPKFMPENVE